MKASVSCGRLDIAGQSCRRFGRKVAVLLLLIMSSASQTSAKDAGFLQTGMEGVVADHIARVFTVNVFGFPLLVPVQSQFCKDLDPDQYLNADAHSFMRELQERNWCVFVDVKEYRDVILVRHYRVRDQQKFESDVRALLADPTEERLASYAFDLRRVRDFIPQGVDWSTLNIDRLLMSPPTDDPRNISGYGRTRSNVFMAERERSTLARFGSKPTRFIVVP
jgi:hypothetical protein